MGLEERFLKQAKVEIVSCMKCGKCRSVCPVFSILENELFVARGKLKLTEKLVQDQLHLTPRVKQAIEECLLCKSCSTACPAGVKTEEVMLLLRWYMGKQKGLGIIKRLIYRYFIWYRWPLTLVAMGLGLSQRILFISKANPLKYLFPLFGVSYKRNIPRFALVPSLRLLPQINTPLKNEPRMRVAYFVGCAGKLIYPQVPLAVVKVLTHYGIEVIIPKEQKCSGMPVMAGGDFIGAEKLMQHNYSLLKNLDVEAIIVACSSCGLSLKEEIKHFVKVSDELTRFINKVYDINEFIDMFVEIKSENLSSLNYRVTYHDPCHLSRGQGVRSAPRKILQAIPGIDFVEMQEADSCCGGSGSYSLTHYSTASAIGRSKVNHIAQSKAEIVATACPSCVMHIEDSLIQQNKNIQMKFVIELLAEAIK